MRGGDERSGSLFSYVDLEARVGKDHPLQTIRGIVNEALAALSSDFSAVYARIGRPSIPPEKLLRAMLLQAFYSIRAERQLMERLEFDLLFRWFVGIFRVGCFFGSNAAPWVEPVPSKLPSGTIAPGWELARRQTADGVNTVAVSWKTESAQARCPASSRRSPRYYHINRFYC